MNYPKPDGTITTEGQRPQGTTRVPVLVAHPARIGRSTQTFTPEGPLVITELVVAPGTDIQAGDFLTVVTLDRQPGYRLPQDEYKIEFVDTRGGALAATHFTIYGAI